MGNIYEKSFDADLLVDLQFNTLFALFAKCICSL